MQRYTVSQDGKTVYDSKTNLTWWRATLAEGANSAQAEEVTKALGDGWREATQYELESLRDLTRRDPAIDTEAFPDVKSRWYRSCTPVASYPSFVWGVNFGFGLVYHLLRDSFSGCVLAVFSGPLPAGQ